MNRSLLMIALFLAGIVLLTVGGVWGALPVADDPLVRMPGTQPGQVSLEGPGRCLNCHAGYDQAVEPGFNWIGSMMAQAARDPLWWAAFTVTAQDSMWALGSPNAADMCERCHFPKGWLEGRSDPPNASLMTGADYDGVQCDLCHRMVDPFYHTTYNGTREGGDWAGYWDESNASDWPSQAAADATYAEDAALLSGITRFDGQPFFSNNEPWSSQYTENGSGQFFVSPDAAKRAGFADHDARHTVFYSRYHKSRFFCSSCHDVSNAALANLNDPAGGPLTTETGSAFGYFHVERTFSEFMLSDYGQQGGAAGLGPFAPGSFTTSLANNYIARCQDCHMPDVVGAGADKSGVLVRPTESVEHPQSGQPLHDFMGGNAWVPHLLASTVPGSAVYDATNEALLKQGPALLTLDLAQGEGLNVAALLAARDRALDNLQAAAAITDAGFDPATGALSFRVQNQTGHRLTSGFPEGRRIFVNVRGYQGGALVYEVNPYDSAAATLKGLPSGYHDPDNLLPDPAPLDASERYEDALVYEVQMSSSLSGETKTFHVALADSRYKDNRIPPLGYDIAAAPARLAEPVWNGASTPGYFTAAEYAGGYDEISLALPAGLEEVTISLYYQTTSREYLEFLRDETNGTATSLPAEAYVIQSDDFFAGLRAWGDTIWQLWRHNRELPGAAPVLMAQLSVGSLPAPALQAGVEGSDVALSWTPDPAFAGYEILSHTAPYFQPADPGVAILPTSQPGTWQHAGAAADVAHNYCYLLRGITAGEERSAVSNKQCEFTFGVVPGQ